MKFQLLCVAVIVLNKSFFGASSTIGRWENEHEVPMLRGTAIEDAEDAAAMFRYVPLAPVKPASTEDSGRHELSSNEVSSKAGFLLSNISSKSKNRRDLRANSRRALKSKAAPTPPPTVSSKAMPPTGSPTKSSKSNRSRRELSNELSRRLSNE
ncbi:hypothetical protein THAOC_08357, partial [Thalassiosira oceanica]